MIKGLTLMFALTFAVCTQGQVLNVKNGVSFSKLDWEAGGYDYSENTEPIVFYSVFAGLEYAEHDYFFISSDLGYVRKGTHNIVDYIGLDGEPVDVVDDEISLDYLSFNSCFNLTYPINEKLFPYISVGPRMDLLINYADSEYDTISEINFVSVGMVLGGGIKYQFEEIQIGVCSNYNLNFSKVAAWDDDNTKQGGEIQDKTFLVQLMVGYIF